MQPDLNTVLVIGFSAIALIFLLFFLINQAYDRSARNPSPRRRSQQWQGSPVTRSFKSKPLGSGINPNLSLVSSIIGLVLFSALRTGFSHADSSTLAPDKEDYIPLPPPQSRGATNSELVQLSITNSSPEEMKVFFKGVEKQSAIIPHCPECQVYAVSPPTCPTNGVTQTYSLKPGDYEVDIQFSGANTRPYRGHWSLMGRNLYSRCFTLTYGVPRHDPDRQW
jgi:hypothetical protein